MASPYAGKSSRHDQRAAAVAYFQSVDLGRFKFFTNRRITHAQMRTRRAYKNG
jgi:hypothetical protein